MGLQESKNPKYRKFYRDIIEVLDSVGVQVADSNRNSLDEVGTPEEVANKLIDLNVPKGAPFEIVQVFSKKDAMGRRRDFIEYVFQWKYSQEMQRNLGKKKFNLHNYAMITVDNDQKKQYIVIATAEDKRWGIVGDEFTEAAVEPSCVPARLRRGAHFSAPAGHCGRQHARKRVLFKARPANSLALGKATKAHPSC